MIHWLCVVLVFTAGFLSCLLLVTTLLPDKPVTIGTVDTLMVRKIKDYHAILDSIRTIPVIQVDTIYAPRSTGKDTTMYVFHIPVMPYHFLDSLPISVNGERRFIPFDLLIDGSVTEYSIATNRHVHYVEKPSRHLNWKAAGIVGVIGVGAVALLVVLLR